MSGERERGPERAISGSAPETTRAIRFHETGGPEVLRWEEVPLEAPGEGEARLRHTAIGLNYSETSSRRGGGGASVISRLPLIPGREAAGVIEALGPGVADFKEGDRVAYGLRRKHGADAERRNIEAAELVPIPGDMDDRTAAAIMVKGMTASYLLRKAYPVAEGRTVMVHAASGGVGTILVQWAKRLGATVIGTVGSEEKARRILALGCDHALNNRKGDFSGAVLEITGGAGVDVIYDPVGRAVWEASVKSLKTRGALINFGNISGPIPPIDPHLLMESGSIFVTKTALRDFTRTRDEMLELCGALFDVVRAGGVKATVDQTYALKDAARAHADLEAGKTTGSTVLLP